MNKLSASFLAVAVASLLAANAHAQSTTNAQVPDYQIERLNPATGAADYIDVVSPIVVENLNFNAGGYFSYALNPLTLPVSGRPDGGVQVKNQIVLNLIGSIGFFDFMEVGLLFPITLHQTWDDGISLIVPSPPSGAPTARVNKREFGVNDARLNLKFKIFDTLIDPVGLGVALNVYFPTGTKQTLTSDAGFGVEGLLLAEYNIFRNIRAAANLGYRWRQHDRDFNGRAQLGSDFVWALGLSVPLWFSAVDFLAEFDGSVSVANKKEVGSSRFLRQPTEIPTELRVAARWAFMRHLTLTAGVGTGLTDKAVGSPDFRFFLALDGRWLLTDRFTQNIDYDADNIRGDADQCPELPEDYDGFEDDDGCPDYDNDKDGVPDELDQCPDTPRGVPVTANGCPDNDRDGDGIPDNLDQCPEDPEDKDGFQDDDGCPDLDNDNDGIPDSQDKCPDSPETFNGFEDDDGCPDTVPKQPDPNARVKVGKDSLIIIEQVFFETAKAKIRKVSYSILDEVAKVLDENPQILLIRVEGHTDSRGNDKKNLKLSQDRADAVREYLINKGIAPERMKAVGFGEEQPIDDNNTKEGRQRNRRVEFKMLKMKE